MIVHVRSAARRRVRARAFPAARARGRGRQNTQLRPEAPAQGAAWPGSPAPGAPAAGATPGPPVPGPAVSPFPFPFRSAGRLLSHFSAERLADFGLAFSAHCRIIRLGLVSWDRAVPRGTQKAAPAVFGVQRGGEKRVPAWPVLAASLPPGSRLDLDLPSLWPASLPALGGRARVVP